MPRLIASDTPELREAITEALRKLDALPEDVLADYNEGDGALWFDLCKRIGVAPEGEAYRELEGIMWKLNDELVAAYRGGVMVSTA